MRKLFESPAIQRWVVPLLGMLALLSLVTGVTMAWFTNQYRLSSIGKIHPLTYISILAPGDAVIQSIDLSYDKSEVIDGVVTLKRPLVIRSETPYYDLCIAHTTNISGLRISLYQATANGSEGNAYLAGITENGTPYYWNRKDGVDLFRLEYYLNALNGVADKNHAAHRETFRLTGNDVYYKVQKNAEPLYWVNTRISGDKRDPDDGYYYTNYILEITWDETDKETDILYVIAQTHSEETGESS